MFWSIDTHQSEPLTRLLNKNVTRLRVHYYCIDIFQGQSFKIVRLDVCAVHIVR